MRILLLSDIHANLEALDACIAAAPSYDEAVNLGDIVGYGASPNEVAERSRALGKIFVRGNHDKAATGLMNLDDFNPMASAAAIWTRDQLTPENLQWLRELPHGPVSLPDFPDVQLVHGSPNDEDEYVVSLGDALAPLITLTIPLTFFGHTHLQGGFFRQRIVCGRLSARVPDCGTGGVGSAAAERECALPDQSRIGRAAAGRRLARRVCHVRYRRAGGSLPSHALQPQSRAGSHLRSEASCKAGHTAGRGPIELVFSYPRFLHAAFTPAGYPGVCSFFWSLQLKSSFQMVCTGETGFHRRKFLIPEKLCAKYSKIRTYASFATCGHFRSFDAKYSF